MGDRKKYAIKHFFRRALERHGLILSPHDVKRTVIQIKTMSAEFLRWTDDEDNFRSFYRVRIYGKPYIVLYDVVLDVLVTIYHNSWLKFKDGVWVPTRGMTQKGLRWKNVQRNFYAKRGLKDY